MAESISLTNASKTYVPPRSEPVVALSPTDLVIEPGEFFSLVGPSGCGKTTILNLVAGLIPKTEGQIRVGDRDVHGPSADVSIVFQKPNLLRWLTVMDNILLPSKVRRRVTPEVRASAERLLEVTGLADHGKRYPRELSGGMQQRVSIVRALAASPDVLLMDEPFSALDEFTREKLNDEILSLWTQSSQTVLFVTHNISEAVYLSDRVGVMRARPGRLEAVIDIDLPRPRTPQMRSEQRFFELVSEVRMMFDRASSDSRVVPASL